MNSPGAQTTKVCSVHMCRLTGYAHSIWLRWFFGTFALKIGQKGLKMGIKCLGLVWFGWAWPVCDTGSWLNPKLFSNWLKQQNWKFDFWELGTNFETHYMRHLEFFFSSEYLVLTQDHNYSQAKLYHTKPKHFRPTFRPFWPIFRAKVPAKTTVTKLSEHSPSIYTYGQNIFW